MLLVAEPILGEEEKAALADVIDSGWITMGEQVRRFEQAFAHAHGADDSLAVNSCTAGLHLIMLALGIGPGDEVLVPAMTFAATANSVLYVGGTPVFVDIESTDVPLMSIEDAAAKCTERTRAVVLVHYAGYLADRAKWQAFASERGLALVEDAAHAAGLEEAGTFGVAAAFSFYGNKNMTTAEGGAVTAADPKLLEAMKHLRGHGLTHATFQRLPNRNPTYDVTELGYNYRLDELRAALGLVQLAKLKQWNEKRAELTRLYRARLEQECPEVQVPFSQGGTSAHHIMPVLLPKGVKRQAVIEALRDAGVQTTVHYPPVHQFSLYRSRFGEISLPLTEEFSERELTLPLHPSMNEGHVEMVAGALAKALRQELHQEKIDDRCSSPEFV